MIYNKIIDFFKNKNIAIVGFGKEGVSTYKFIRKYLANQKITILDYNENIKESNPFLKDDRNVDFCLGTKYLDNLKIYDLIIKAPGVKFKDIDVSEIKQKITSQLSLIFEYDRDNIISVTGTKGKSTTSSLIYKIIHDQGIDSYLLGNIGIPIFDYIDKFKDDTLLIIEAGVYQLEYVNTSPHIGIVLNLFEEHLDFFKTKDDYFNSKLNMFKYQREMDYGLYTDKNELLNSYVSKNKYKSKMINVDDHYTVDNGSIFYEDKKIYDVSFGELLGDHNLHNIVFALRLSEILGLNLETVIESVSHFKSLAHRMEYVCDYNGAKFYNDAIATIPEATINCIKSLKDVDTLILGGMDRGINYDILITFLNSSVVQNFICLPDTGKKIGESLLNKNVYFVDNMEEAVKIAKDVTKKICVMSPAASSYNVFKNFEEKGNLYKELLQKK